MLKPARPVRALLFAAIIALTIGLLGPTSPGSAAPITGFEPVMTPLTPFDTPPSVTITGTAKVGVELTAVVTATDPTPDSYTYQWKTDGTTNVGTSIPTYTPVAA